MVRPARSFAASIVACLVTLACHANTDDGLGGVGTVEITETDVAPMVSGRVTRVWVDEGTRVRTGDTLVTLTHDALPA